MHGKGRERERENPKQALLCQCRAQCRAWCRALTHKSWDHNLSWGQGSNTSLLSYPEAPQNSTLNIKIRIGKFFLKRCKVWYYKKKITNLKKTWVAIVVTKYTSKKTMSQEKFRSEIGKKKFLFWRERGHEKGKEAEEERKSERERILSRLHAHHSAQCRLDPTTLGLWSEPKSRVRCSTNWATQASQVLLF